MKAPQTIDINLDGKMSMAEWDKSAKDKKTSISTMIGYPQTPTMINFRRYLNVLDFR
jgi:hypothetical protein